MVRPSPAHRVWSGVARSGPWWHGLDCGSGGVWTRAAWGARERPWGPDLGQPDEPDVRFQNVRVNVRVRKRAERAQKTDSATLPDKPDEPDDIYIYGESKRQGVVRGLYLPAWVLGVLVGVEGCIYRQVRQVRQGVTISIVLTMLCKPDEHLTFQMRTSGSSGFCA